MMKAIFFLAKKSVIFHLLLVRFGIDYFSMGASGEPHRFSSKEFSKIEKLNKRILLVGMSESPHLHTWIDGMAASGVAAEIRLFPSDLPTHRIQHSNIKVFGFPQIYIGLSTKILFKVLDLITGRIWRSLFLYREIKKYNPTHLHFHETQNGAYLYNPIARHPKNKFSGKTILSTWGSDLIYYNELDAHHSPIRKVMSWIDLLTAERNIDYEIAKRFGFRGVFMSPVYITVGSKVLKAEYTKPSSRSLILIKGYQDKHGRALNALASIELVASQLNLSNFEFKVFSASKCVKENVRRINDETTLNISTLPRMPKSELMELYKKARVYLGIAISDGLSTSMVEAMTYGTFPIQSRNSSAPEFLQDGVTGGVVDPHNIEEISRHLKIALLDNDLVDNAALSNFEVLKIKYNWNSGIEKIVEIYG